MLTRVSRILEYDKMKEQLKKHTTSTLGDEKVDQLEPMYDFEDVEFHQQSTYEGTKVLRLKGQVQLGGIRDIRASVKRAVIGGMLNEQELLDIASTIHASRRFKTYIEGLVDDEIDVPILQNHVEDIVPLTDAEREIKQSIDENGEVLDSASPQLRSIRQQIRQFESTVRSKLESITRSSNGRKMLSDAIVTIRNERYVLPVKQEYRTHFGGLVHDQSSSGATVFVEPESVVATNNQLREAKSKEAQEIDRILHELSQHIAEYEQELLTQLAIMTEIDFLFAKAFYSRELKAVQPTLNRDGQIDFQKARHPLIPQDEVVPIDVSLGSEYRSLVITGPNTGGKTVSLKTIGLLTLMAQSGLHIPCEEGSEASVFQNVFADIGDEQSIEQNLSTFSSHMTNIVDILDNVDHESLVLFDELGAGTDPTEGAALAISILDHVYDVGARVVATTHYSELKGYAYNRTGVMNASVEFDVETLKPTYRLLIGIPGRSNAFAISERLGLSSDVIEQAKGHINEETNQMETMIQTLEERRQQAEEAWEEAKQIRLEAENLQQDLETKWDQLEQNKDRLLEKQEQKAKEIVDEAKKEAETIISELRDIQKQNPAIKDHELIEKKKRLEQAAPDQERKKKPASKPKKAGQDVKLLPGDEVKVLSLEQKGHIVEQVSDKEYEVQLGIMKMKVPKKDLQYIDRPKPIEKKPLATVRGSQQHVSAELDLRGERYEDAVLRVEKYIDDAVLAGLHQVSIIHGKGTGALRKGVQQFLEKHQNVKNTRLGGSGEGGSGVTVADLK
ncbi:endonuclease MutS2 [Texcoconibacillus texcoconensis]|uniref:Endonuclease MutS2 n=1 Tax=Texcoconibacillus texcoconensis TaxID=1095777 RepID=A0A840QMS9_9BACI|nr:endonuclease MutS2 [Texcoconibacillus texcoconensis]MBB5172685.1 DNA mismatch repair protein MutS2 [Texcoconibacillus texcoconensis]